MELKTGTTCWGIYLGHCFERETQEKVERLGILPETQASFRKKRSGIDDNIFTKSGYGERNKQKERQNVCVLYRSEDRIR